MKKSLFKVLSVSFALALFAQVNFAQTACLVKDSTISGADFTSYRLYTYDLQDRLVKVVDVDSGGMLATANYDTLIYGANDMVSVVENRNGTSGALNSTFAITYNGSDQVQTMVSGDAAGTWGMTHTVSYSGGMMTDMMVSNIFGNPDGFAASFTNMTHSGGNLMSLVLDGDFGLGPVVIELDLSYDTKNNLEAVTLFNEATDLLGRYNTNNVSAIIFTNQEIIGTDTFPANTVAIQNNFSYTGSDVETSAEMASFFTDKPTQRQYYYDCTQLSIDEHRDVVIDLYPNPFTGSIQVNLDELKGQSFDLVLVNILGVEVLNERYTGVSTVDLEGLEELKSGLYFLQVKFDNSTITRKLVKK